MRREGACFEVEPGPTRVGKEQRRTHGRIIHFSDFFPERVLDMYQALYRKYRPGTFDNMIGQEHIRVVLARQCETGRTSHAYIFCGTRGTGKTTAAKILAKGVNCLAPVKGEPCGKCLHCLSIEEGSATDVLEIDAASNNSVDDIRRLCDELIYPPTLLLKRVYIIDEVHMLSSSAYNALLKTLEEPPEHVLFILATTEINKIPPTVLSRCQRFEFRRLSSPDIARRLLDVSAKENLRLTPEGAALIAKLADGSMRDAFSLAESCVEAAGGGDIDRLTVANQLGIAEDDAIGGLFTALSKRDIGFCLSFMDEYYASAKSLPAFFDDMLFAIRDMLYIKQSGDMALVCSHLDEETLKGLAAQFTDEMLLYFAEVTEDARNRLTGNAANKRLAAELALIRLCDARFDESPGALSARIAALENLAGLAKGKGERPGKANIKIKPEIERKSPEESIDEDTAGETGNIGAAGDVLELETAKETAPQAKTAEHAFESKMEVSELLLTQKKPGVARLLQNCAFACFGGKLMIAAGDSFAGEIIKSETKAISDAVKLITGEEYDIVVTKHERKEEDPGLIDEISEP